MKKNKRTQWGVFRNSLRKYFHDYGGWKAVILSPIFQISVLVDLISYRAWSSIAWSDLAIAVLPNLLGFSLGTYALVFSLTSMNMKRALKALKNRQSVSYLDELNATFLHFIFCQVIAFMWAFCYKQTLFSDIAKNISSKYPMNLDLFPYLFYSGGMIGVLLFVYSFTLVIASSLAVYRLARIVDPSN